MNQLPKVIINVKLSQVASYLGAPFIGEDINLDGFNLTNRDIEADSVISYCATEKYFHQAQKNSKVKALIIPPNLYNILSDEDKNNFSLIVVEEPEWAFYSAFIDTAKKLCLKSSYVSSIPSDVIISKGTVVEDGVMLGHNVVIGSNSVIKAGSIIGNNVTIGNCSVIGGEGFQLIKDDKGFSHAIPHVGRTYIGDNVFIGDNTTISKSLFEGYTVVENNVKIDNHCHVAHNCYIGSNSVLTANVTLFGSSIIGKNVWLSPCSSVMNRVKVGDNAMVCASTFVMRNVKPGDKVFGIPANKID